MNTPDTHIRIGQRRIGLDEPTYFIADIAANHDGDLQRAIDLIWLAAEAGADAAKFQHFAAETIVSDYGFRQLGQQQSHQSEWKKSVFDVYKDASLDTDWNQRLVETCAAAGIDFFTSPYSFELVDMVDPLVPAYKVGSGDITWLEIVRHMAAKGKPVLLATGASNLEEVRHAVDAVLEVNPQVVLMQCNTNYTASLENFRFINLNVLNAYRDLYPGMILGLSDHTPGHATVLGAVALGARVVEKHLTDDNDRTGPDHRFSMNGTTWRDMVDRTRELEYALGDGAKRVEDNERETVVLQRRSMRATRDLARGTAIRPGDFIALRPCPADALPPGDFDARLGGILSRDIEQGDYLKASDIGG